MTGRRRHWTSVPPIIIWDISASTSAEERDASAAAVTILR